MADPDANSGRSLREELRAYYGPLLPHFERSLADRGDLPFWRQTAREHGGESVLELGAGTGRVTRVLSEAAREVVALDLNPEMVARAAGRFGDRDDVHLLVADMRRFALSRRFGLVVCANDPFSHLRRDGDRDAALRRVADHLSTEGRFVLDALWLPPEARREARSADGRRIERRLEQPGRKDLVVRAVWHCDPEDRTCVIRQRFEEGGREIAASRFRGRYWTREEITGRLEAAGLRPEVVWGGYDRRPWRPDSSGLLVRARRRG